ncbi:MAG: DUF2851 family protein [Bacteroidota bacterium]|nr:DUF2851 family protein [Bacteroidota bacterium]MDP3146299.1 DUF2851 family protein [Bacteroidota bacterium]
MPKFNEELLQFLWQHKILKPLPFITTSGKEITVIKNGELNKDSGPDFFNAQIRVGEIVLVGNIEIHIKTSDWLKHKHQQDKNYDNIILHVVYEHDVDLAQNKMNNVEVLELKNLISESTLSSYNQLYTSKTKIPCHNQLGTIDDFKFITWLERMTIERLERKVNAIEEYFNSVNSDYTQTFYFLLLRNFGFNVNSLPFEMIAKNLPITILLQHADNLLQLEALLLGVSGLLENQFEDKYIRQLQNEFDYLKNKYKIIPLSKEIFKFSKLRPANFPTIRLAQFARLIHTNSNLFIAPCDFSNYNEVFKALTINLDGYWKNHYSMDGKLTTKDLTLGLTSIENLIINTFAPFYFFYSRKTGKDEIGDIAIELLNNCAFEQNAKTKLFVEKKMVLKSSADSQATINLYDNYCSKKLCLKCGVATFLLK